MSVSPPACIGHGGAQVGLLHARLARTSGVSKAMTSPYTTTAILSARPNTTPMSCSTVSSVLPTVTSLISEMKREVSLAHARRGLVQQDDAGAAGDGDADFQRALLGVGEVHRQHVALRSRPICAMQLLGTLVGVVQVERKRRKV
jgi:hypothetical protein